MVLETAGIVDLMILGTIAHAGKKIVGKSYHKAKRRKGKTGLQKIKRL